MVPFRYLSQCLLVLLFLAAPEARAAGWKLSWSEEFNGPTVDSTVWGYETGYVRNQEVQYYSRRIENSRIEDGKLLIQGLRDNWSGHAYTSASRTTRGRKSFKYGRFEMRGRIDVRQGSWPAWWWLPDRGGWPKGGEIDMMEFYRGQALFNVMDGNGTWTSPRRTVTQLGGPRWAEEYHTWTMVWDSTRIQLSLDGTLINDYALSRADGTGPGGVNPFRQSGYMIVNQALGGTQGGDPSGTAFPVNLRVDWIRVHSWDAAAAAHTVTVKGGTGTGVYATGTAASITANWPALNMEFDRWLMESGNATLSSATDASATLTVAAGDVTVTATYRSKGTFAIRPGQAARLPTAGVLGIYDVRGRKVLQWRGGEGDVTESLRAPGRYLAAGN